MIGKAEEVMLAGKDIEVTLGLHALVVKRETLGSDTTRIHVPGVRDCSRPQGKEKGW